MSQTTQQKPRTDRRPAPPSEAHRHLEALERAARRNRRRLRRMVLTSS